MGEESFLHLKPRKALPHLAVRKLHASRNSSSFNTGDAEVQADFSVSAHQDMTFCRMWATTLYNSKITPG